MKTSCQNVFSFQTTCRRHFLLSSSSCLSTKNLFYDLLCNDGASTYLKLRIWSKFSGFVRISHFVNCDSNPDPRSHLVEGDEDSYLPYWRTKVASNTRGQQFESSPVIKNCYTGHLLSVNCIEKTKIKKVTGNGLYPPPPNCRVLRAHRRSWPSPSCCWWDSNPRRC